MARATIDMAALAITRIGKEQARSNPGLFFCPSDKQADDRQHYQGRDAEVHHGEYAPVLSGMTFGKFTGHEICKWIRHGRPRMIGRKSGDLRFVVKSRNRFAVRRAARGSPKTASMAVACEQRG
jgi:hypothetical protein